MLGKTNVCAGRDRDRTRSRVTNGTALHVAGDVDGRGKWSRRFRDIYRGICNDMGGTDRMSTAQQQLARCAAALAVTNEQMQARICTGEFVSDELFGKSVDRLARTLARLGLEKLPSDNE